MGLGDVQEHPLDHASGDAGYTTNCRNKGSPQPGAVQNQPRAGAGTREVGKECSA